MNSWCCSTTTSRLRPAGSKVCWKYSGFARMPDWLARASCTRMVACRKRAASSGKMALPGTGGAATIRTGLSTAIYVPSIIVPGPVLPFARATGASLAASTRPTLPLTTKTPILPFAYANWANRSITSRKQRLFILRASAPVPTSLPVSNAIRPSIARPSWRARQSVLKAHQPNGHQPQREADRAAKARVLVVEAVMITLIRTPARFACWPCWSC